MSGAETARRRVVQRRIGGAESAAPSRWRRNGGAEMSLPPNKGRLKWIPDARRGLSHRFFFIGQGWEMRGTGKKHGRWYVVFLRKKCRGEWLLVLSSHDRS